MPSARDSWAILAKSPAIQTSRIDVGGSAAGHADVDTLCTGQVVRTGRRSKASDRPSRSAADNADGGPSHGGVGQKV